MSENSKKWFWRMIVGILFIVSLVYVLFWANGFRYDFLGNQFRKTGIVAVEYANPNSSIILDNKKSDETLPFIIGNLLPGEHSLAVIREGFWEYQLDVNVAADLITRIGSVFLVPLDMFGNSELVFDDSGDAFEEVWLKDSYIFFFNKGLEKNNFSFAKLRDGDLTIISATSALDGIADIIIFGKNALIVAEDGRRESFDLATGAVTPISLPENYIFAGDKWLFFDDDYVAAFNTDLTKVLWVKIIKQGRIISDLRYFLNAGKEYISVDFLSGDVGEFYIYSGGQWFLLDSGEITWLAMDNQNAVFYVKNKFELWKYGLQDKNKEQIARFADTFKILAVDYRAFRSLGVIIFKRGNQFWIADTAFDNVRLLLEDQDVREMTLVDGKKLYFWINKKESDITYSEQGLYVYDFEQ